MGEIYIASIILKQVFYLLPFIMLIEDLPCVLQLQFCILGVATEDLSHLTAVFLQSLLSRLSRLRNGDHDLESVNIWSQTFLSMMSCYEQFSYIRTDNFINLSKA